jgi:iron complex outermembrane receptor protein
MTRIIARACAAAAALCASTAVAQTPVPVPHGDSARIHALDTVVVTPDRSATRIRTSTVAASVIPGDQLRRLPVRSIAGSLVMVPGVFVMDVNSVGGNPRIIARGFYGGGDTDYLSALVDGVPIAALGSGAVDWDLLARAGVDRVEVVRGGSSYSRGDAAIAGAVNLLTDGSAPSQSWRLAGGSHAMHDATAVVGSANDNHRASLGFDHTASRGYRDHEQRKASALDARYTRYGEAAAISFFASTHFRNFDDPGALPSTVTDPTASNPFYRFDHADEKVHRGGMSLYRDFGAARASGYVVGEYSSAKTIKTLPLSTDFADTKLRRTEAPRVLASTQLEVGEDAARSWGRVVAGLDASAGRFTSRYSDVASGTLTDYSAADASPGAGTAPSRTTRESGAAFAHWQVRPVAPLRISLSARYDHVHDAFSPGSSTSSSVSASHDAFSPRVALNIALPGSARVTTNAFFSAGRVFKAPTLDQLFDDRAIPVPFPPGSVTISNSELVPQRGKGEEGGGYATILMGSARLDLSLAAYEQRMRDELDFDLNSFHYVNIGRSRHRGVELGSSLTAGGAMLFANFSRQSVVAQSGEFEGHQLKAIPRTIASAGADLSLWRAVTAGVVLSSVAGMFVDDANSMPLAGYTRADVRLGVPVGRVRLTLDVMNALDRRYDATAFPDPGGSDTIYRYPAAGRVFVLGLESR